MNEQWHHELPCGITVCDKKGVIIYMNEKSEAIFAKDGGKALLGSNLLDCHPEKARKMLETMLETQESNSYTIEKNNIKKLIHQTPWFEKGEFAGYVEFSIELPMEMPHFIRTQS